MNFKGYTKEQLLQLGTELLVEDKRIMNYLLNNGCSIETDSDIENFEKAFNLIHRYEKKEREELTCDNCKHINLCEMYRVWRNEEAVRFQFPEEDFSCRHHTLDKTVSQSEDD